LIHHGILTAGGVVVSLNPLAGRSEIESAVADCQPDIIITDEAGSERIPGGAFRPDRICVILPASEKLPALVSTRRLPGEYRGIAAGRALAILQFTGGTTGQRKAAMMSHRNLVVNAVQNALWFAWTPQDAIAWVCSLSATPGGLPAACIRRSYRAQN